MLIVYAILNLAHPKKHVYYMSLYNIIVLEPFIFFYMICDYVTVTYDGYVIVCNIYMWYYTDY